MLAPKIRPSRKPAPETRARPRSVLSVRFALLSALFTAPVWIPLAFFLHQSGTKVARLERRAAGNQYVQVLVPLIQAVQFHRAFAEPDRENATALDQARHQLRMAVLHQRLDEWKRVDDQLSPLLHTSTRQQSLDLLSEPLLSGTSNLSPLDRYKLQCDWMDQLLTLADQVTERSGETSAGQLANQALHLIEALTRAPATLSLPSGTLSGGANAEADPSAQLRSVHDAELELRRLLAQADESRWGFDPESRQSMHAWMKTVRELSTALEPAAVSGKISSQLLTELRDKGTMAAAEGGSLVVNLRAHLNQDLQHQLARLNKTRHWAIGLASLLIILILHRLIQATRPVEKISLTVIKPACRLSEPPSKEPLRKAA